MDKRHILPLAASLLLLALCSGCTYKADVRAAPAANIYSSYEGKIPGHVILVMDKGGAANPMTITPSSYVCGAHKYSLDPADSFLSAVRQTTESVFDGVIEKKQLPSADEMRESDSAGYILVKVNRFAPRLRFDKGFFTATGTASAEISLDVLVKDRANKTLLSTMVSGVRSADGDAGGMCEGGSTVLADAVAAACQEAMERYAERVSNSQTIRTVFEGGKPLLFIDKSQTAGRTEVF